MSARLGLAVRGDHQQAVVREPVEISRSAALENPDGLCHLPCCGTGMPRNIDEDDTITAVPSLQEILTE